MANNKRPKKVKFDTSFSFGALAPKSKKAKSSGKKSGGKSSGGAWAAYTGGGRK